MNTKAAILAMMNGAKVRRIGYGWCEYEYIYFTGNSFMDESGEEYYFNNNRSTLWEIYNEKKKEVVLETWLIKCGEGYTTETCTRDVIDRFYNAEEKIQIIGTCTIPLVAACQQK